MINRTIAFLGLAGFLAIACSSAPKPEPPSTSPLETTASAPGAPTDTNNIKMHLRDHQKYPATKTELVAECNNLADFSAEEKAWFGERLPDRTYSSSDDVINTLGI